MPPPTSLRIAHFVQRYPPALGGSEAYFARLSRYLADQGDQVTVFTTNAIDLEAFWKRNARSLPASTTTENGIQVRRYGLVRWPGRRYCLKPLSFFPNHLWQCLTMPCNPIAWRMWTECGKSSQPFDVVHATAFPYAWPIVCALRLARRQRIPFVLTPFIHTGDPDDPSDRTRRSYTTPALMHLAAAADQIFVQTDVEQAALLERGIPAEKVTLLGMGVEPVECTGGDRQRARAEWGIGNNELVIGHLANLSEEKGSVDLLRAAEILWQRGRKFRVVLAGAEMPNFRRFIDGRAGSVSDRRNLQHLVVPPVAHTPGSPITLLGVLDDRQRRDFYAGIDLFALPSRSDSFGLVLLEAWANGVPNVAYRAGGIAGVIRNEMDGLLATCGDVAGLANDLERLLLDAELRRRLGEAGKNRLGSDYCWGDKLAKVRQVCRDSIDCLGK